MVSNTYVDVILCLDKIFDLSDKKFHFHFFMIFSLKGIFKALFTIHMRSLGDVFEHIRSLGNVCIPQMKI